MPSAETGLLRWHGVAAESGGESHRIKFHLQRKPRKASTKCMQIHETGTMHSTDMMEQKV